MGVRRALSRAGLAAAIVLVQATEAGAALNLVNRIHLHPAGFGAYYCDFACADQSARRAFFTGRENGAIAAVDMNTQQVTHFISTGGKPYAIDANESAQELYFTLPNEQCVGVVPEVGGSVERVYTGGGGSDPVDIAASDRTGRFYAANRAAREIVPVRRPGNVAESPISVPGTLVLHSLAVDHSRLRLYAGCQGNPAGGRPDKVLVIDIDPASATFHTIVDQFDMPQGCPNKRMAVNEVTNRVYTVGGETLAILDVGPRQVRTVQVQPTTEHVAVDPIANLVWVARTCALGYGELNCWFVRVDGSTEQVTGLWKDYWLGPGGIAPDHVAHCAFYASGTAAARWEGSGWPQFVALAYHPTQIALDATSHRLWTGDAYLDVVHEVDLASNQVTRKLMTEDRAHIGIAFDPAGFLYATCDDRNTRPVVAVLDAVSGAEITSIQVHPWPEDVVINPTSLKAYVACPGSTCVDVIDIDPASVNRWKVTKSIQVDPNPGYGNEPWRQAVDADQNLVFVVTMGNPINQKPSRVVAIDSAIDEIVKYREFAEAGGDVGIGCLPSLKRLYVGLSRHPDPSGLDILDGDRESARFLDTIHEVYLPYQAYEVAANPLTSRVYARCGVDGTIAAIDGLTGELLFTAGSERYAARLAVNRKTSLLFVGAPYTSSILVFRDETHHDIGFVKRLPDGRFVELSAKPVTAGTDQIGGDFYIEEPNRSCGIRVQPAGVAGIGEGQCVDVAGKLDTLPSGERAIVDARVRLAPLPIPGPAPCGMPNRSVGGGCFFYDPGPPRIGQIGVDGGFGLNNIGLLVKTWGRVESSEPGTRSFVIDDGSGVDLKCVVPTGAAVPAQGHYVAVSGISSCEASDPGPRRVLLLRKQDDIRIILE